MELDIELDKVRCPYCQCEEITPYRTYETTQNGTRTIFKCTECQKCFSETKNTFMEGIKTPFSFIAQVFEARTDGSGLNAACRTFKIAKNTLLDWERKLSSLKDTFLLYALTFHIYQSRN